MGTRTDSEKSELGGEQGDDGRSSTSKTTPKADRTGGADHGEPTVSIGIRVASPYEMEGVASPRPGAFVMGVDGVSFGRLQVGGLSSQPNPDLAAVAVENTQEEAAEIGMAEAIPLEVADLQEALPIRSKEATRNCGFQEHALLVIPLVLLLIGAIVGGLFLGKSIYY